MHISCHGDRKRDYVQFLMFENEFGGGDIVLDIELELLMQQNTARNGKKIHLVFLAACDS